MEKDTKQLIKDYIFGETITEISLRQGVSRTTVRKILKENNIYGKRKINPNLRKYSCNEHYFDDIDCHNKAYWLGFIAADGYIHKDNKRLTIELHVKDISLLEKFAKDIESNHPVRKKIIKNHYNGNNTLKQDYYYHCIIQIWSPLMVQNIIKYDIHNNKSLSLDFPKNISNKYINSFLLGYFDGDGSCVVDTSQQLRFRVTGNYSFLKTYQQILMNNCQVNKTKLCPDGKAFTIQYGGNKQCKRIYDFLYNNHDSCLQRKKDKFDSILDKSNKKPPLLIE